MAKEIDRDRLELRGSKSSATFKRSFAGPLDIYSYYDSLYDAEQYAQKSPVAYVGQLLVVSNINDGGVPEIYKIIDIQGTLAPVGEGELPIATVNSVGVVKPDGTSVTITQDGTISATGGGSVTVDDQLSTTSTNPVQNKVITNRINQLAANDLNISLNGTTLVFTRQGQ